MWHIRLPSAVFVRVLLSHPQGEYDASTPVPFGVLHDVEVHLTMVQQYVCLVFVFGWRVCVVVWGGGALGSFSS